MTPVWKPSAERHHVPRGDQIHAILHATYTAELKDEVPPSGRVTLFIGHPHPQTDREIEVLVHEFPDTGEVAIIFHAMELGPKFRRYREEYPNE